MNKIKKSITFTLSSIIILSAIYGIYYLAERHFWLRVLLGFLAALIYIVMFVLEIQKDLSARDYERRVKEYEKKKSAEKEKDPE